jgi:glutamyl-tRNA reductase
VLSFAHWLDQRAAVPLIQALHQQADQWREAELMRARKQLAKGEDVEAVLEAMTRGLTQKLLHGTLAELRGAGQQDREQLAAMVSRLFLRGRSADPGSDDGR